jgi:hypothetical protein
VLSFELGDEEDCASVFATLRRDKALRKTGFPAEDPAGSSKRRSAFCVNGHTDAGKD